MKPSTYPRLVKGITSMMKRQGEPVGNWEYPFTTRTSHNGNLSSPITLILYMYSPACKKNNWSFFIDLGFFIK